MIEFSLCLGVGEPQYSVDVVLSGSRVSVFYLTWNVTQLVFDRSPEPFSEGQWDFTVHTMFVADERMTPDLVDEINSRLGKHMRSLEVPRQSGLFPNGCSVCGATETLIGDAHSVRGESIYEQVRWTCHVCDRLVCPGCTLTRMDRRLEFYFHTYCCEACRAAAPVGFTEDDEDMGLMLTRGQRHDRVWKRSPQVAVVLVGVGILPATFLWWTAGSFWARAWLEAWVWVATSVSVLALALLGVLRLCEIFLDRHQPGWREELDEDP